MRCPNKGLYGPTTLTVTATWYRVKAKFLSLTSPSLGSLRGIPLYPFVHGWLLLSCSLHPHWLGIWVGGTNDLEARNYSASNLWIDFGTVAFLSSSPNVSGFKFENCWWKCLRRTRRSRIHWSLAMDHFGAFGSRRFRPRAMEPVFEPSRIF